MPELYERPPVILNSTMEKRWYVISLRTCYNLVYVHNTLVHRGVHRFAKLGNCLSFEARPAILHFGGFRLNTMHTQRVKITNMSATAKRLQIINPTTKAFKLRLEKIGALAPGMSQMVEVDFEPKHWNCLLYTSPSPRDQRGSRMPSSA